MSDEWRPPSLEWRQRAVLNPCKSRRAHDIQLLSQYNLGQFRLGPAKFGQPHIAALNCKVAQDSKRLPTYRQGRPELITMIIGVRGNELIQQVDLLIAPASQVAAIARACQFTTEPSLGTGHLMSKQMSNESKVDGMRRKNGRRNKRK